MTRPRHHTDVYGGRHTTHVPFALSDSEIDPDSTLSDPYDGWGFDPVDDEEETP